MLLGLVIDESLSWKDHITQLIPKLSKACYALRSIRLYMTQDALKTVYYSYLHSLISYGINFWGNSSYGLKQGDAISPLLFSFALEYAIRRV
jgi:hypothetical protein